MLTGLECGRVPHIYNIKVLTASKRGRAFTYEKHIHIAYFTHPHNKQDAVFLLGMRVSVSKQKKNCTALRCTMLCYGFSKVRTQMWSHAGGRK